MTCAEFKALVETNPAHAPLSLRMEAARHSAECPTCWAELQKELIELAAQMTPEEFAAVHRQLMIEAHRNKIPG